MKRHSHTYEELQRVGQRYYSDTNFCGVIATAVACQVAFGKSSALLKKMGRQKRRGTYDFWQTHVATQLGCRTESVPFRGKTLGMVCRQLPRDGVYWVYSTRHVTCVDHGQIMDWAKSNNRKKVNKVIQVHRDYLTV